MRGTRADVILMLGLKMIVVRGNQSQGSEKVPPWAQGTVRTLVDDNWWTLTDMGGGWVPSIVSQLDRGPHPLSGIGRSTGRC